MLGGRVFNQAVRRNASIIVFMKNFEWPLFIEIQSIFSEYFSPPLDYNATHDLCNEVYAANTTLSFTAIVTDHGNPVRGATASVTFLVDNSCLVDVEFGLTPYAMSIDNTTGEVFFRVPGYYYFEYGISIFYFLKRID